MTAELKAHLKGQIAYYNSMIETLDNHRNPADPLHAAMMKYHFMTFRDQLSLILLIFGEEKPQTPYLPIQ